MPKFHQDTSQEKNEAIYIMGCPCHIVHNTAGKAGDAFYKATGFNVDVMVVDLFYWFDKALREKPLCKGIVTSVTLPTVK